MNLRVYAWMPAARVFARRQARMLLDTHQLMFVQCWDRCSRLVIQQIRHTVSTPSTHSLSHTHFIHAGTEWVQGLSHATHKDDATHTPRPKRLVKDSHSGAVNNDSMRDDDSTTSSQDKRGKVPPSSGNKGANTSSAAAAGEGRGGLKDHGTFADKSSDAGAHACLFVSAF